MKRLLSSISILGLSLAMVGTVSAQGPGKGGPNKGKGPGAKMHEEGKVPGVKKDDYEKGSKPNESNSRGIGPSVSAAARSGMRGVELAQYVHSLNANRGVGKLSGPRGDMTPSRGYDKKKANEKKAKGNQRKDKDDERKGPPNRAAGPQGKAPPKQREGLI